MPEINWTPNQRAAVEAVGQSIVVSAAAGSGKTAVLAERCAFLVCDVQPPHRCTVDQLLVVTFTEAAAAEMKTRIRSAIERRLAHNPNDDYLQTQLALIETAQISTVHSFCSWMIRRWFNEARIDPTWPMLEADDARILKADSLEEVIATLYDDEDEPGKAFKNLVDAYGLGSDQPIVKFTLRLAHFLETLPDPDDWLAAAHQNLVDNHPRFLAGLIESMRQELALQRDHVQQFRPLSTSSDPVIAFYAQKLADHADQLDTWHRTVSRLHQSIESAADSVDSVRRPFDEIRSEINDYKLSATGAPRSGNPTDAETQARDAVKAGFKRAVELFKSRIRKRYTPFSMTELVDGLTATAPYASALVDLVQSFRQRYQAAKRHREVLDFADLERNAFDLLQNEQVMAAVRQRFAHVLVDEYQDINPLQDALLRRISQHQDEQPPGKLFSVGDIKQSIYRFRGAEPNVFLNRLAECRTDSRLGQPFFLPENFRSRQAVLDGINDLFTALMRSDVGGIDYGPQDALRRGRQDEQASVLLPIDIHILDSTVASDSEDSDLDGVPTVDPNDPAEWSRVEREAYLIANEIRRILDSGITVESDRPPKLGDFAILLRASAHTADAMARMLARFGIDAYSEARGTAFDTLEIRDIRALLEVLDNAQQDIPLAAVLRSGVLGQALSEDDLVAVRVFDRNVPFHRAAHRYQDQGPDADLQTRLKAIFGRIRRFRHAMRERPIAEVLHEIIEQTGYLAYVGGLAGGAQRRANLLRFCRQARRFGAFKRQGLRGFLHFIDALQAQDQDIGAAPAAGQSTDAVRIMSIHAAKGLEFPIVFVADLGRAFNTSDAHGRMILDRRHGICLRVVDPDRLIEYASATHQLAVANIERNTRAEELRVLYVAMTRAKEKLILVGTAPLAGVQSARLLRATLGVAPSPLSIATARTPLDWIIPAAASLPEDRVDWSPDGTRTTLFNIHAHDAQEMADWKIQRPDQRGVSKLCNAVGHLLPLPSGEPSAPKAAAEVLNRLRFDYPHLAVSSVPAVVAAAEAKGRYDLLHNPEEQLRDRADPHRARQRGTLTHLVMQHIDFAAAGDRNTLVVELNRLVASGVLTAEDVELIDMDAIEWFVATPLGQSIGDAGDAYHREFMFLAAHSADRFDDTLDVDQDERVLVRGIVDGVLEHEDGLEVIDFKTDSIRSQDVDRRAETYRGQMTIYADSITPLFNKPVKGCRLVFLHPRVIVPVDHRTSPNADQLGA